MARSDGAVLFAISVAVGLTPEMLPMIVTTNLAIGALMMGKGKVIVKRLNSVQNLGAMNILCTDKTGTLTADHVRLEHYLSLTPVSKAMMEEQDALESNVSAVRLCEDMSAASPFVLLFAYFNAFYQTGFRNPMDMAITAASLLKFGNSNPFVSQFKKVDEVPFDFARRRMSVVIEYDNQSENDSPPVPDIRHLLICKGAVEEMIGVCKSICFPSGILSESSDVTQLNEMPMRELNAHGRSNILALCKQMNESGLRVLVVAFKFCSASAHERRPNVNESPFHYTAADEADLVLLGILTFADPPKPETADALKALSQLGVVVKVLTGDNPDVAKYVCNQVGIEVRYMLLGRQVSAMSDAELNERVEETVVFAKLTPEDKQRVVKALNGRGHIVGFLGDGINDAPALRSADVGISVDNGVDIAKEAADLILLEKDLVAEFARAVSSSVISSNILKWARPQTSAICFQSSDYPSFFRSFHSRICRY